MYLIEEFLVRQGAGQCLINMTARKFWKDGFQPIVRGLYCSVNLDTFLDTQNTSNEVASLVQ
jgi:hypothetical protein